jgi:hypothetical protein
LNNGVATTTPEPSTWVLLSTGLALLVFVTSRIRNKAVEHHRDRATVLHHPVAPPHGPARFPDQPAAAWLVS